MTRSEPRRLRGMLLTLAPVLTLLGPLDLDHQRAWLAMTSAGLVGLGALVAPGRGWPRLFATLGILLAGVLWTLPRLDRPGWVFLTLLAFSAMIARLWPDRPENAAAARRADEHLPPAALGAVVLLICWVFLIVGRVVPGWERRPDMLLASLVPALLAIPRFSGEAFVDRFGRPLLALGLTLPALGLIGLGAHVPAAYGVIPVATALCVLGASMRPKEGSTGDVGVLWLLMSHPPRLLVATFAIQCLAGGFLLVIPAASNRPEGIALIDALFTSVSATCVTGLTVVDTATAYSPIGQGIVLALIQVGGLGIMTFSAAAFVVLARRMSFRHEATAADLVGAENVAELSRALLRVLAVTFAFEGVGALGLATCFWFDGEDPGIALWHGLFTAVSAFCNAGFGLRSDNLVHYANNPFVLHIVATLIIVGGLGPAVVVAAPKVWRYRARRVPVHVLLVLEMTALLLIVPAVLIAALEWEGSLAGLSWANKLHNAWFQSVTLRTAGFNSIDLTHLHPATVTVMIATMFIGGSPGSTAGGAKTTTIAILGLAAASAMTGRDEVDVHRRRIPHEVVYRAGAITSLCLMTVGVALFALQMTQAMPMDMAMFEAVSAMGTVGLTIGGTPLLDDFGKLVIMGCMFAGRVGPLTLFLLFDDARRPAHLQLAQETVPVG